MPNYLSMHQQMWKGWSLGTNVTSMTSVRYPKRKERRWDDEVDILNLFESPVGETCLFSWLVLLNTDPDLCLLLSAGAGVRHQVHGDQCKGQHQRRECEFTPSLRLLSTYLPSGLSTLWHRRVQMKYFLMIKNQTCTV